jgi:hypothetical protein
MAQGTPVPIDNAIDSGDISATFSSTGAASGHIADLSVTSNADTAIELDLANSGLYGKVLANPNLEEQDEVITDTPGVYTDLTNYDLADTVTLDPGQSLRFPVIGYCLNFDLDTPSQNVGFTLQDTSTKTNIDDISTVLDTLENYQFPGSFSSSSVIETTQMTIWMSQPKNADTPMGDYEDREYNLNDNELATATDIMEQSGVDTDNVAALTGETQVSDQNFLYNLPGFPWGYPWGYPWGLPLMGIPCYTFLFPLIFIVMIYLINLARRGRKRPKGKKPSSKPDKVHYAKTRGPVILGGKKPKDCEELIRRCKEARKEAEKAQAEAEEAGNKG